MTQVTTGQFFAALYADPRDIMPRIVSDSYPYATEWRDKRGELFGKQDKAGNWYLAEVRS